MRGYENEPINLRVVRGLKTEGCRYRADSKKVVGAASLPTGKEFVAGLPPRMSSSIEGRAIHLVPKRIQ